MSLMNFSNLPYTNIFTACLIFLVGLLLAKILSSKIESIVAKRLSAHQAMLIKRAVYSIIFILFLISGLQQLGFHFGVLLGAAGVFTVAISFASQTSIANLISGIFLLIERPFKVGDYIEVKSMTGKVHSIDLLSTKIITADNQLIRLPNESLIKAEIVNLSYFSTRRVDMVVGISYQSNIKKAIKIIEQITNANPLCLQGSNTSIVVNQLLDSAIELKISAWVELSNLKQFKNEVQQQIVNEFNQQDIEIPYPQLVIHKTFEN